MLEICPFSIRRFWRNSSILPVDGERAVHLPAKGNRPPGVTVRQEEPPGDDRPPALPNVTALANRFPRPVAVRHGFHPPRFRSATVPPNAGFRQAAVTASRRFRQPPLPPAAAAASRRFRQPPVPPNADFRQGAVTASNRFRQPPLPPLPPAAAAAAAAAEGEGRGFTGGRRRRW